MNILVCYDNSKFSKNALKKAIEYNKKFGGSVNLIHVLDSDLFFVGKSGLFSEANRAIVVAREMISEILQRIYEDLHSNNIQSKIVIKEGNVVDEITNFVKNNKTELVIAGRHGTGLTKGIKLGSIATKLSQSITCDLLITH